MVFLQSRVVLPKKSGDGFPGLDLNSGWNCAPMKNLWEGSSIICIQQSATKWLRTFLIKFLESTSKLYRIRENFQAYPHAFSTFIFAHKLKPGPLKVRDHIRVHLKEKKSSLCKSINSDTHCLIWLIDNSIRVPRICGGVFHLQSWHCHTWDIFTAVIFHHIKCAIMH